MLLLEILVIAAVVPIIKAEVDCSKRPPPVDIKSCCEISSIIWEDVKEKCSEMNSENNRFGGQHQGPPTHHHYRHGRSCIVNATGILVDGELQEDNINTYLNRLFVDTDYTEFLRNKFVFCNEKRNDFASKMPEHKRGPPIHGPFHETVMLIGCVSMQSFKNCPDSSWANTDECNEARDHLNQCWVSKDQEGEEEKPEEI